MKKALAVLLSAALCVTAFAFTGCGKKETKTYATLDDLKGQTVVAKTGTTGAKYADSLKDQYNLTILTVDESSTMYTYLASGQAAACFEDYPIVQYEIARGNVSCKVINTSPTSSPYGMAVMKGTNPELVAAFNEGLWRLKKNGTYETILKTYFGDSIDASMYTTTEASSGADQSVYSQAAGKTYAVGTDTTFAPFEFENDKGVHTGIDIQLFDAIAKEMGFTIDWKVLGFNAAVTALEAGQVNAVMAGMSITAERSLKYDFSASYYNSATAIAVQVQK